MCTLITVKVVASDSAVTAFSVVIDVTLMCTSLVQHCHCHCCHKAVLVFAVTALCTSVPGRCVIPVNTPLEVDYLTFSGGGIGRIGPS